MYSFRNTFKIPPVKKSNESYKNRVFLELHIKYNSDWVNLEKEVALLV